MADEDEFDILKLSSRGTVSTTMPPETTTTTASSALDDSFSGQWGVPMGNHSSHHNTTASSNGGRPGLSKREESSKAILRLEAALGCSLHSVTSGNSDSFHVRQQGDPSENDDHDKSHHSLSSMLRDDPSNATDPAAAADDDADMDATIHDKITPKASNKSKQTSPPVVSKITSFRLVNTLGLLVGLVVLWMVFRVTLLRRPKPTSSSSNNQKRRQHDIHSKEMYKHPHYARAQAIHKILVEHHVVAPTTQVIPSRHLLVTWKKKKKTTKKPTTTTTEAKENKPANDFDEDDDQDRSPPWSMAAQQAFDWLVQHDPAELVIDHPDLVPRFVLAVWYFSNNDTDKHADGNDNSNGDKSKQQQDQEINENETAEGDYLDAWMTSSSICQWKGILCAANKSITPGDATTQVTHLHWISNNSQQQQQPQQSSHEENVGGTIPPELSALSHLQSLDLRHNGLHGSIPPYFFSHMQRLKHVRLDHNRLTGPPLPRSLAASAPVLEELHMGYNDFTGTLPATLLSECTNLKIISVQYNPRLTGHVPSLEALTKLNVVELYEGNPGLLPPLGASEEL